MATTKFHVFKDLERQKRTTVSLDNDVYQLLSLKFGSIPDNKESHKIVRKWLQAQLDEDVDPYRVHSSQWLQRKAVLEIVDKNLSNKYWDWRLGRLN